MAHLLIHTIPRSPQSVKHQLPWTQRFSQAGEHWSHYRQLCTLLAFWHKRKRVGAAKQRSFAV